MSNRSPAKERAQNFGDPNYAARKRIVDDPEKLQQRLSGLDRNKYDVSGYSDKDIGMAMRGDSFGDDDFERLTGKKFGAEAPKQEPKPQPQPTPEAKPDAQTPPAPETDANNPNPEGPPAPQGAAGKNMSNQETNDYYSQKAEFDWNYSKKAFNVNDILEKNIKKAKTMTKADEKYKGLKQGVHDTIGYYRNKSNLTTLGIFGDIWNTNQRPTWKAPGTPKPITTTYNSKDKDKDDDE